MTNDKLIRGAKEMLDTLDKPVIDDPEDVLMWLMMDGVEILEDWLEGNQDTKRLDFLQEMNDEEMYTGRAVFRLSDTHRGWRLHESSRNWGVSDVREAIDKGMKRYGG